MKRNEIQWYRGFKLSALLMTGFTALLVGVSPKQAEAVNLGGSTHIGTFEGQTTFQTSSSNGINPGLYLEVMDRYGNYTEYTSEDGVITVDETKEGAYVTQAKFLGKTKYVDQETGEVLDQWEEGRDLKLESVKMPVLTTTGKNLFDGELEDGYINSDGTDVGWSNFKRSVNFIKINPKLNYTISKNSSHIGGTFGVFQYDDNKQFISSSFINLYVNGQTFTFNERTKYIRVSCRNDETTPIEFIQIEEASTTTSYEPYKSNILTVNEEVKLRGIGEVRDELNLITGELTQRIGEVEMNGSETWSSNTYYPPSNNELVRYDTNIKYKNTSLLCDNYDVIDPDNSGDYEGIRAHSGLSLISLYINKNKLTSTTINDYLKNNPFTVQYSLPTEVVKTVDLTSTYTFGTVAMRDVYVDGKVKPLLCSVNVPTENLTFVLDPNQEEEKQFIAPTFRLINETPTSVRVSLTAFKQESNVFNDVSPTKYENWSQLNKEQSRDIALALVPLASDNWVTVDETPRYVNNYSASVLGEIKAKSSVDLTFKALHGQAFTEELNPQYRLVFLFDF